MGEIPGLGFGTTVTMLGDALQGASLQQNALANNIANADTPNYRRQSVSFKQALAEVGGGSGDPNRLALETDNPRQFSAGGAMAPSQAFDPKVTVDTATRMRSDGSNVDIDQEMAEVSQNSGYSQTMAKLLQVQFKRLREAITELPN